MQDKAYSQILDEVRPFYGKDGFIDEKTCAEKFTFHSNAFLNDRTNSILLMRALAWYELILSDGIATRIKGMPRQVARFNDAIRMWTKPVNSFHFVRTMVICIYRTSGPDTFIGNRLLERLYAKRTSDSELELCYIYWSAINPEVKQNRTTMLKLLAKQEKLEFRKKARVIYLADAYKWVAIMERPLSKELTEKSIQLRFQYIESLPPGHALNTPEYRAKAENGARILRGYFKHR